MTSGPLSRRIPLTRPVPVHVLYATAAVGDDGIVRFYPDIYGHDSAAVGRATEAAGDGPATPTGRLEGERRAAAEQSACADGAAVEGLQR